MRCDLPGSVGLGPFTLHSVHPKVQLAKVFLLDATSACETKHNSNDGHSPVSLAGASATTSCREHKLCTRTVFCKVDTRAFFHIQTPPSLQDVFLSKTSPMAILADIAAASGDRSVAAAATVVLLTAVILLAVRHITSASRFPCPLPPSPPAEPFFGHYRRLPLDNAHLTHIAYAKEFNSDIVYFNVLGNHMIVLNSQKVANELLDKRGAIYQDRPNFVLFDVMGWGLTLTFLPYGPRFKLHRSALQTGFTKTAIANYRPIQEDEARRAVARILRSSDKWDFSLRRFASAIVLRIGFGVQVQRDDDPYIQIAIDANSATAQGGNPGTSLVDYMPLCESPTLCSTLIDPPNQLPGSPLRPKLPQLLPDAAARPPLALGHPPPARRAVCRHPEGVCIGHGQPVLCLLASQEV